MPGAGEIIPGWDGYKLSIEDRGIGMSQDFFENVFMDMLSSTKEDSADQIGHFGIGW
jgi:DNA topoisomerase VI subunit B